MKNPTEFSSKGSFNIAEIAASLPETATTLLVHRLAYNGDVVAFKMGRRQGGPSRTGVRGRISKSIRNRRATQPPAHFHRNPLGRGRLTVFPRCSLLTYRFRYARRSRLEKQPTDLRRKTRYFGDRALASQS